jgi:hypothetical protein
MKPMQLSSERMENDIVRITRCFPSAMEEQVRKVIRILSIEKSGCIHAGSFSLQFHGEKLEFPYRVYFNEPRNTLEKDLTEEEKVILDCIFLLHHNGHIRQRRLERLIDKNQAYIIPFTFQLLGEYVKEILTVLDDHVNENTLKEYLLFIAENKKYFSHMESRMISYWNMYYRKDCPKIKRYIGQRIFDRIKKELPGKVSLR